MAEEVDNIDAFEQEDREDEFMAAMESDPSQAELMCVCQRMNQLMITLKCKKDELSSLETEAMQMDQGLLVLRK